ncbi:DUF2971 domain-containing protein [Rhizobium sp. Nf11,1]|uniref:DUF2971 domain-containing protein n=1 Tax=Rhizobium sp. Nf11,1 TaxID=3404923 RepID=UPI003D342826
MSKQSKTMMLYYFTKEQYALESLRDRRIKVARFRELNDPFDFIGIATVNADDLKTVKQVREKLDESTGLLCMSKSWQQPLLWGHYADSHKGICLGFEVKKSNWKKVNYRTSRPRLSSYDKKRVAELTEQELEEIGHIKFKAWEYEKEYRRLIPLGEPDMVNDLYFEDFGPDMILKMIYVGPRCKVDMDRLKKLRDSVGGTVVIHRTRPSNLYFKVIRSIILKPLKKAP